MSRFTELLIAEASRLVGVEEVGGTNCGPVVNEIKKACPALPHDVGWPWCAAFVCHCVQKALAAAGIPETATFKAPTTAAAFGLITWSLEQDDSTSTKKSPGLDIRPGDLIVFTFSHCGIAISAPGNKHGTFRTIEGNTDAAGSREGGGVFRKERSPNKVRARIRFTFP